MIDLSLLKEGKIWCYNGKVIVTDFSGSKQIDAVFPICRENLYFVDRLIPKEGVVLDLCTGSGILAIFAADKAQKVIVIDINPRALDFARLNIALNVIEAKIEFRSGDLWEPVAKEKFDLILANPPFEPHDLRPLSQCWHSDGGSDGTAIVQRIINGLPNHLNANGVFQMITWLLENRWPVLEKLKNHFGSVQIDELGKKQTDFGLIRYLFITALNFKGGLLG